MTVVVACSLRWPLCSYFCSCASRMSPTRSRYRRSSTSKTASSAIYDNLRDLQFEYRLGKLSDEDYRATKQSCRASWRWCWPKWKQRSSDCGRCHEPRPKGRAAKCKPDATVCPHCGASSRSVKVLRRMRKGNRMKTTAASCCFPRNSPCLAAAMDGTVVNQTTGKPAAGRRSIAGQARARRNAYIGTAKTDAAGKFHFDSEAGRRAATSPSRITGASITTS